VRIFARHAQNEHHGQETAQLRVDVIGNILAVGAARRRLTTIRYVEDVIGNVAMTWRYDAGKVSR
jgi:hypothetical protein